MIHYAPLQQRGQSNSPYSIADQLAYDRRLFPDSWKGTTEEGTLAVWDVLKLGREKYGLMSMTDVVLNHTADNSPWLQEHPEAGYSPFNTPHLAPAVEIDDAIIEFSGSLEANGLPTTIKSQADLDTLVTSFQELLNGRNLWQYYVFDVEKEKETIGHALDKAATSSWDGPDVLGKSPTELAILIRGEGKLQHVNEFLSRFCVSVDSTVAVSILRAAYPESNNAALVEAWGKVVDVLNVPLYEEWKEDTRIAIDGIRNRLKYLRLEEGGPKFGPISEK